VDYCQNTLHLNLKFDIEFLPFRLISIQCLPEDPPEKYTKREFLKMKMGLEKYQRMEDAMIQWASEKNYELCVAAPPS